MKAAQKITEFLELKNSTPLLSVDLILDREAIGRLRRELSWTVGEERTHGVMARVGVSCGLSETVHGASKKQFFKGFGELTDRTAKGDKTEYIFEVHNSCEAAQYTEFNVGTAKSPQCWLMAGYLTGKISGQTGQAIYFIEVRCGAKQDSVCRFIGKPKETWPPEFEIALEMYNEDNIALELMNTREQLKLTKDRYQNLFEQSSSAIGIMDPDTGIFLDVNVALEELTGFTKDELLRMNIFDLQPATDHHRLMSRVKSLLSGEHVPDEEIPLVRKDGSEIIVALSSKILNFGGQKVVQNVMRDITDLKTAELKEKDLQDQLLRSERLSSIGRLAAGVAHEIKNPLGAIRNAIYYIKNAVINTSVVENDPQVKVIIKLAEDEVDGAVRTIEELLDFSRVFQLIPRRTMLNEFLERLPSLVQVPENVTLIWDLDITLPAATVDPDRLNQVFSNIMTNAFQAMANGGTLTIKTRMEVGGDGEGQSGEETVAVIFEDTGSGINPQHLKKIFEPLFTTKARGTGLGLAISNNIVELHGGKIIVTSKLGKGTCFTVKLPLRGPSSSEENNGNQKSPSR